MKKYALLLFTLAVSIVTSTPSAASNLVFVRQVAVSSNGASAGVYWISLPYLYTPVDSNSNSIVDAEDLVQDLQPASLSRPCSAATSIAMGPVFDGSGAAGGDPQIDASAVQSLYVSASSNPISTETGIFSDGFEPGGTSAWSGVLR